MKIDDKSRPPSAESELWLPPLSHKTEEEIMRVRKSTSRTKEVGRPKKKAQVLQRLKLARPYQISLGLLSRLYQKLGFKGRALWDWLPLLLAVIGILAIAISILTGLSRFVVQGIREQQVLMQQQLQAQKLFTQQELQQQQILSTQIPQNMTPLVKQVGGVVDQQHDLALTNYLDYMSSLLVSQTAPLLNSTPGSTERMLAQTRTVAILSDLSTDALRKGIVVQFLHDTGLILTNPKNGPIIQLANIDLSGISLKQGNLASVDFDGAILSGADLDTTTLTSSSFRGAILTAVNFSTANLQNADLSGATLENANFTGATMKGINLAGADTKNAIQTGAIW